MLFLRDMACVSGFCLSYWYIGGMAVLLFILIGYLIEWRAGRFTKDHIEFFVVVLGVLLIANYFTFRRSNIEYRRECYIDGVEERNEKKEISRRIKAAKAMAEETIASALTSPHGEAPTGKLSGVAMVVLGDASGISTWDPPAFRDLEFIARLSDLESAPQYLFWIEQAKEKVGDYHFVSKVLDKGPKSGEAYVVTYDTHLIDVAQAKIVSTKRFVGPKPPDRITSTMGSYVSVGIPPDAAAERWMYTLFTGSTSAK